MLITNKWKMSVVALVFSLSLIIPVAQAEQQYDITDCGSMTFTVNSASDELTIVTFDFKGIARSNSDNKIFDNFTVFYVGVSRNMAGKQSAYGYSKYMDPDGDFVVMESIREGEETHCKFLQGTGKWKGIKGEGKVRRIAIGKPISPGTSQYCTRHIGTFELPKK
jgi:hypothetical protein